MNNLSVFEKTFIVVSFAFQFMLICHFALRRWRFDQAIHYGWIVYAASIPAALVSIYFLFSGISWSIWLGGFIYLVWASYGYYVEYIQHIEWRTPIRLSILVPYITLYLATVMFYWWPLALIDKPLWYFYGVLFLISTALNINSHQGNVKVEFKERVI